jgi:hypothetical protein
MLRHRIRVVLVDAQVNILGPKKLDQVNQRLAPCSRAQLALLFVYCRGYEDLLIIRVRTTRRVTL